MAVNDKELTVVIVDDVIATGGTLKATIQLCEKNNFKVNSIAALINLKFLNSLSDCEYKINSVLNYE
jgi:adenine phosphoribosyltransferase